MRFDNLTESFYVSNKVIVSKEGSDYVFEKGNDKYEYIIKSLQKLTENSHEMPAYGVSLDEETRKERQNGLWIELVFDSPCKHEGMDFDSLLIEVKPEYHGFNLIRKVNGKYEGRCFFISLDKSTNQFYKEMSELSL